MAEYRNDELQVSFSVPDRPTVRQVLRYDEAVEFSRGRDTYERLWLGVCKLAENWVHPSVQLAPEALEAEDLEALPVLKWAGLAVFSHVQALKDTPKNS